MRSHFTVVLQFLTDVYWTLPSVSFWTLKPTLHQVKYKPSQLGPICRADQLNRFCFSLELCVDVTKVRLRTMSSVHVTITNLQTY